MLIMETTQENKVRFKETISMEGILRNVESDPLRCFEEYPIMEARLQCLKMLKQPVRAISLYYCEWLETCITDLLQQRDGLGKEVLSLYFFTVENDTDVAQALKFAISLKNRTRLGVPKLVADKLLKQREILYLYPLVSSLPAFLVELLDELRKWPPEYDQHAWEDAEYAQHIIIAAEDYSFLPKIEELILLHREGVIQPREHDPPFTKAMNMTMLKETRRLLKAAEREKIRSASAEGEAKST